ncbi:MAG TPA: LptE family protein [Flavobacteriales bacterium]|nr:LptE family protein [Flavobacteriales bacterium]
MKRFWVLLFISVLALQSCKLSLSGGNYGEAKTISIAFFPNNAALVQPTLSQAFTEDMRNFFQTQSPLSLVQKGGDLHLEGAITDYRVGPVGVSSQTASTNRLTITVNVKFTNRLDSTKDFDSSFSRFVDFPSSQNLVSVETELIRQINQQLIQDVFNKALINW